MRGHRLGTGTQSESLLARCNLFTLPWQFPGSQPYQTRVPPKGFFSCRVLWAASRKPQDLGVPGPFAKLPRPSMAGNSHDSQCGLSLLLQDPVKAATTHGSLCSINRVALSDQRRWLTLACLGTPPEEPQNQHIQRLASDHSRASQSGTSKG